MPNRSVPDPVLRSPSGRLASTSRSPFWPAPAGSPLRPNARRERGERRRHFRRSTALGTSAARISRPAALSTCIFYSFFLRSEELEHFYAHLEKVLRDVRFLDPDNPRHLMRRLRRLFLRAAPDQNEINILRGILTAVERHGKPGR